MTVKPIERTDAAALDDTGSYGSMSMEERLDMIRQSEQKRHDDGRYFELFKVIVDGEIIGFMNLYAHSAHIISCGPEIKPAYRRLGYACAAEKMTLEMAKSMGYTIAVARVQEDNAASRTLHEKLGFELDSIHPNKQNHPMCLYIKAL